MVHLPPAVGAGPGREPRARGGHAERRSVRIGIVTQSYYPRYGGVTEHVHNTARELTRRGHEVTIVTGHFRPGGERLQAAEIRRVGHNVLVPFNRAFVDVTLGVRLRRQMRRLLRSESFDLVHV